MLRFYVATGVIFATFMAAYFAWTPLRIWYWERQVRQEWELMSGGSTELEGRFGSAVDELTAIGPQARPALQRLLRERFPGRSHVLTSIRWRDNAWLVPTLAEVIRHDPSTSMRFLAIREAEDMTRQLFYPPDFNPRTHSFAAPTSKARKKFLDWWELKGKARYEGAE